MTCTEVKQLTGLISSDSTPKYVCTYIHEKSKLCFHLFVCFSRVLSWLRSWLPPSASLPSFPPHTR